MANRREFTVGIFIVVGFVLFLALTVMLRNLDFLSNRHTFYVMFDRVERLEPGAAVLAYGAQVGAVSSIAYVGGPHPVMVTLRVDKTVNLYPDADIRVAPATVIGETTINIESTGKSGPGKTPLPQRSEIVGTAPANIETIAIDLSQRIGDVLDQLVPTLTAINKLVSDQANQQNTKQILENFATASETLDRVTNQLETFLDTATSTTQHLDKRIAEIGDGLDATAAAWQKAGASLDEGIRSTSGDLRRTVGRFNQALDQNQKPLAETIERLNRSAERLEQIVAGIQKGQGTLGALVTDPRPFDQLRELINNLSASLTGGRQPLVPFPQNQQPGHAAPPPRSEK
ncbi:MAG: MlaD family protein [Candidatus Sumerlaeia bacterium]